MRKEQRAMKKGRTMPTRRTSEEEEDHNNNEEEDCAAAAEAAAAAAAATAAATAVATTGHHASFTATSSDQAVASVAAAWHSGLRGGTVAAAECHRCDLFFSCLISDCSLCMAQNTITWVLPSRIPAGILDSVGFWNKSILPWNDLIPTCVSRNRK